MSLVRLRLSIRSRLTLWYGACLCLMLVVAGALIWFEFDDQLRGSLETALRVHALDAQASFDSTGRADIEDLDPLRPGIFTALIDRRGLIQRASTGTPEGIEVTPVGASTRQLSPGGPTYALYRAETRDEGSVITGSTYADVERADVRLGDVLLTLGLISIGAALMGGWWLAGRALAPIGRLSAEAAAIDPHDLSRRLPERGRDELGRLTRTLNGLLGRLEAAVGRERAFITGAAHDLRTPITALRTELELATVAGASREQLLAGIEAAHADSVRLSELADGLLRLAEAEAEGQAEATGAVSLAEVVGAAERDVAWMAGERSVRIDVHVADVAVPLGRVRFQQAIVNLLTNAVRLGPPASVVELEVTLEKHRSPSGMAVPVVWTEVRDHGPGIDPARRDALFVPFAGRSGRSSSPHGLGLATAAAAVRALGGDIGYRDRAGGGSVFWFWVPLTSDERPAERRRILSPSS